jgi:hypothetical protein
MNYRLLLPIGCGTVAGCAVNQARETAAYRKPLDEKIPPAAATLEPGEVLTLPRALAMANYQNERLALGGEDYLQADILVATGETYYQILSIERQVKVLQESVQVQEDRAADVRARVKAGVTRELDQRESEAQAAGTRAALIDSRNRLATARAGLVFLIGVAVVDNPLVDGFEVPALPPLEEAQPQATRKRQDVLAAAYDSLTRRQVDKVGHLDTPVAGAKAKGLTAEIAENAEKKTIK